MGAARKSAIITDEDKLATAYHEGGHAVRPLSLSPPFQD
jgi:ATP-dependent Zn protease